MKSLPRLLETYEEARMLLEAKGWGVAKAAEHLAETEALARFNISQATANVDRRVTGTRRPGRVPGLVLPSLAQPVLEGAPHSPNARGPRGLLFSTNG